MVTSPLNNFSECHRQEGMCHACLGVSRAPKANGTESHTFPNRKIFGAIKNVTCLLFCHQGSIGLNIWCGDDVPVPRTALNLARLHVMSTQGNTPQFKLRTEKNMFALILDCVSVSNSVVLICNVVSVCLCRINNGWCFLCCSVALSFLPESSLTHTHQMSLERRPLSKLTASTNTHTQRQGLREVHLVVH